MEVKAQKYIDMLNVDATQEKKEDNVYKNGMAENAAKTAILTLEKEINEKKREASKMLLADTLDISTYCNELMRIDILENKLKLMKEVQAKLF